MENQECTNLMAIDLSAAFDTVDHVILLDVLQKRFRIEGVALSWFDNYLHPHFCKVNVGKVYSSRRELECCVPQGSCAGPILYTAYASTLESVVLEADNHNCNMECEQYGESSQNCDQSIPVALHGFADDHALKNTYKAKSCIAEKYSVQTLERKAVDVKEWMYTNHLKMNDSKTEFVTFASKQMFKLCTTDHLNVNDVSVPRCEVIKYLRVWLDQHLQLIKHITVKCGIAVANLQRIKLVRPFLTKEACHMLTRGLVTSHLDYCNAIFTGLPECLLKRLQFVQNCAAKLVLGRHKFDCSKEALAELHWLPLKAWIDFKVLTLVHKCLSGDGLEYLRNLLTILKPNCEGSRSSVAVRKLLIPRTKQKTFADRSFSIYAPQCWNALLDELRNIDGIQTFKSKLKMTYFYQQYLL